MKNIILASASPRRKELLCLLGVKFQIQPAKGEEVLNTMDPEEAVLELSAQKAKEIADQAAGDTLIIGSDTVVALNGEILGKPENAEVAVAMIQKLQGKPHSVFTGVTLIVKDENGKQKQVSFAEETRVFVSDMTEQEIQRYVALGQSLDKAGAYGIQGPFGAFVEKIEGDYNNVVGLPVSRLYRELCAMGIDLFTYSQEN